MHRRSVATMLALLFLVPALSGCFGSEGNEEGEMEESHWLPPVEARSEMIYRDDDVFSRVYA